MYSPSIITLPSVQPDSCLEVHQGRERHLCGVLQALATLAVSLCCFCKRTWTAKFHLIKNWSESQKNEKKAF